MRTEPIPLVGSGGRRITDRVRDRVFAEVQAVSGVTTDELLSKSQRRRLVDARWLVVAKLRSMTTPEGKRIYSLMEVGRVLNRDHTTIMNAERRMKELSPPWPGYDDWYAAEMQVAA